MEKWKWIKNAIGSEIIILKSDFILHKFSQSGAACTDKAYSIHTKIMTKLIKMDSEINIISTGTKESNAIR